jgi:DNA-binding CsgD family transcriptional regulator
VAEPGDRVGWLTRAADVLEPSETRLDYAHAVYALGCAQREARDEAARDTLRVALDLAEQCGGRRLARRVLAELHAAGSRPRRHRLEGPGSLTESEARVAQLTSSGLSTREIAEQLVVTPRTVAFHLGNVYRKLGISGRGELTAALKPPGD